MCPTTQSEYQKGFGYTRPINGVTCLCRVKKKSSPSARARCTRESRGRKITNNKTDVKEQTEQPL